MGLDPKLVLMRLAILQRKLEDEGLYTRADAVSQSTALITELLAVLTMLREADDIGVREGYSGNMGASQRARVDALIAKVGAA